MAEKYICLYDPKLIKGAIGMYHCPECGEMVVAGVEHHNYALLEIYTEYTEEKIEEKKER